MQQQLEQGTTDGLAVDGRPEPFGRRLNRAVGAVARQMSEGALSTGELAELRRISPDAPYTPALWRVLHSIEAQESPAWISQERYEQRWATLLMGMAHCVGLHNYEVSLGSALLQAGWSEVRFTRLLEEEHEGRLATHVRRMSQYLASKNQPANWADVARLLFYQSGEAAQNVRLGIARAYYGALYRKESE